MAQSSQTGSTELSYNNAALLPPWQRDNTPEVMFVIGIEESLGVV